MTAGPYILKVKDNSFINLSYHIDKIESVVDITLCQYTPVTIWLEEAPQPQQEAREFL